MALKLVGLCRVSTDQQVGEDGEGLGRQIDAVKRIAAYQGAELQIVEVRGVSGTGVAQCEEWQTKVLPAIRAGAHIAADALDRIIRQKGFDLRPLGDLQQYGARIYLPGQILDTRDPRDIMVTTIFSGVGGYERMEFIRRCKEGKAKRMREGKWAHRSIPLGLTYDRDQERATGYGWGYDDRAELVREAFVAAARDGAHHQRLASMLGVTKGGVPAVMRNPVYKGVLGGQGEGVRVFGGDGQLPQLVSDDVWDRAQVALRRRVEKGRKLRSKTHDYAPYSGLLRSEPEMSFSEPVTMLSFDDEPEFDHTVYSMGRKDPRYGCRCCLGATRLPVDDPRRCGFGQPPAAEVNKAIDTYLVRLTSDPTTLQQVKEHLEADQDTDKLHVKIRILNDRISQLERKESTLLGLLLDGRIDRKDHDKRQDRIRADRQAAEDELSGLDAIDPSDIDYDTLAGEWAFDPSWSSSKKREWCRRFVPWIGISTRGIENVVLRLPAPGDLYVRVKSGGFVAWSDLGAKIKARRKDRARTAS